MHVRVRLVGKRLPETIVVVNSKLTKIEEFRSILEDKFAVASECQRLYYGGKLLEDSYTFYDYKIRMNDVIQVIERTKISLSPNEENKDAKNEDTVIKKDDIPLVYEDAKSTLYEVGDYIDMRARESGAWYEGKIIQIVYDPNNMDTVNKDVKKNNRVYLEKRNDLRTLKENKNNLNTPPVNPSEENTKSNISTTKLSTCRENQTTDTAKKGVMMEQQMSSSSTNVNLDEKLLYKVELEEDGSVEYCKLNEIRPRARVEINMSDLKCGMKVMLNYNFEHTSQTGLWYDYEIVNIEKLRSQYKLTGIIYLGSEQVPESNIVYKAREKIFQIEEPEPLKQRSDSSHVLMQTTTEMRSRPLRCSRCCDDKEKKCKECACFTCGGKEDPDKTLLCDECERGYHIFCLSPPLPNIPEGDWYCPSCKRDPNDVVAPGGAKQVKKTSQTNRDWGRGMACVGKTKTCAMPANHFGPIPGIEVGMSWRFRIQLSESGVHRPPVSGIHGRDSEGAYSLVLSGGYEDDVDKGDEFTYTGSGGRDLSGNKRTAEQSSDQILVRENRALARNCAVKDVSEEGADAGEKWRDGKPVRVVRSYKMLKHCPKYAPKEGMRYDGIYKVVKYYPEKGLSGFKVWKYLLRRDDPSPAPWEPGAKQMSIIYPDGYLEAEAEKKALKQKPSKKTNKKAASHDSDESMEMASSSGHVPEKKRASEDNLGPAKKRRKQTTSPKTPKSNEKITQFLSIKKSPPKSVEISLADNELNAIAADNMNVKLWDECLQIYKTQGKTGFLKQVTQSFLCIICQDMVVSPVTTPCLHNFCLACLKRALKITEIPACPCCRQNLSNYTPQPNDNLKQALQVIFFADSVGKI